MMMKLIVFFLLHFCNLQMLCSASLPSDFYQPSSGVYFERWISSSYYSMSQFNRIPSYPDCPTFISHSDNFEYTASYSQYQYGRFRASFVSTQTGIHKFFAIFRYAVQVYIEINPTGARKILDEGSSTSDNWNYRKWCDDVTLMQGFRYEITVYHYGNGVTSNFFRLGVKFPDNTEVKPITNTYLRRSMEYYEWKGLLAHKYENFQFPSSQYDYTMALAYSMNPAYPSNPASYLCRSTLYEPGKQEFDYYALKSIGYLSVPESGDYTFRMKCNELCQVNMTKSGSETVLGEFNDAFSSSYTTMSGVTLSNDTHYLIKVFFCESFGYDYIQVSHSKGGSTFSTSWTGMLRNLLPAETAKYLPLPVPTMINSTAISIQLPSTPYLPPKDTWAYIQNHEILYHRSGVQETPQKLTINGALPQTTVATGLNKYTDYVFYAHYFGTINGKAQNIITTYSAVMKTDEDVPESAPPNLALDKRSSTEIRAKWDTLATLSDWNGISTGFEVQYRLKNAGYDNWTSVVTSERQYTASSLLKYRIYEFKVAARTSKGSGILSAIKEERTMEDVPTGIPSNITAWNTSSSSIIVSWDDVPIEHQNGIITGYKVYLRRDGSSGSWYTQDTSSKQLSKSGLDLWITYDIKISAKTSIGEGPVSSIVKVRTDEDIPGAPPRDVSAVPLSATSINVTWSEIIAEKRYGVIISYKVKYKRADGVGVQNEMIVKEKFSVIKDLTASIEYEIIVAGMTIKGVGVFSPKISLLTNEDAPDGPPVDLRGNFTNATAIRIYWGLVPIVNRKGTINRYNVQYRTKDSKSVWQDVAVGADLLTLHVTKLEYYTIYEFRIAAETAIGRGPYSNLTYIRTDAYAPSKPPMNLTGHFLDHRSINMTWSRVPKEHRQGIITGYKLYYKDKTLPDGPWYHIITPNRQDGDDMFNQTVSELKIYTPYVFKISAFTYKAEGVLSDNITVWTDESEPKAPPRNISGVNASSTGIVLRWQDMKEIDGEANGQVLGYTVKYRVVDCHEDRPEGCDENEVFNITTNGSSPEIIIPNLRKYTTYNFSIQVFNSKGRGGFSSTIIIRTDEDVPDQPPTKVETWPSQSNSMKIFWSRIPKSHRNGIILGYRVFYKAIDEPQRHYERAPRSVNQYAIYGALPGEKMVEVNSSAASVEIKDLKDYSWYQVRIGALTSKGLGATFTLNGTTKQGTPVEAPVMHVTDMLGFDEISITWKEISKSGARGEVLGYRIQYWLSELHEDPVIQERKYHFDILEPNRTAIIKGLQAFAQYRIRIQAFTESGFGIWSPEYGGGTCRCSRTISSARIVLPPLANANNLEILPDMLGNAITSCCGNCSGKHGPTLVNWDKDGKNLSSIKYSKQEALNALADGTNLALPIFRDSFELEGDVEKSEYIMVPLLESSYIAIFIRKSSNKELGNAASSIVTSSLWNQYPLYTLSGVMTILAGILFWIFEWRKKRAEFSESFFKGIGSGLWLAYITMTTVGYGDLTPMTRLGKMHAMVWMLVGLALTSMLIGNISSAFCVKFILQPDTVEESNRVLTSEETLMSVIQLRLGKVVIGNTSDGKFVQQSLLAGNVSSVALDIYTAGTLKDYLNHPQIIMKNVEPITASYSAAIAGETKRIRKCIGRTIAENSKSVLEKVEQQTYLYKLGSVEATELYQHIGSNESDIMENSILYCGILLAALLGLGVMQELARYARERGRVETDLSHIESLSSNTLQDINNLEKSISEKLEKIQEVHAKERVQLTRMKMGQLSALVYMYPALTMFDPDMAKLKKNDAENDNNARDVTYSRSYYSSDEDDSDFDRPIDYKTGN